MATAPAKTDDGKKYEIILKNVRISYPNLFAPKKAKGKENDPNEVGNFSATFLLDKDKDKDQIEFIKERMTALLKEQNKGIALPPDKVALRDGDMFKPGVEGYENQMFLTSSNKKRPQVKEPNSAPKDAKGELVDLAASDPRMFGGVYVNAIVRLWFQENDNGKRVNGSLEAVQYVKPGEPFGAPPVDATSAFGGLGGDDETDPALL